MHGLELGGGREGGREGEGEGERGEREGEGERGEREGEGEGVSYATIGLRTIYSFVR